MYKKTKTLLLMGVLFGSGWGQVFIDGEFLRDISPIRKIVLSPTFEADSVIAVAGETGWMIAKLPEGPLKVFYTGEPVQDLILEGSHLLVLTLSSLQMYEVGYEAPYLTFTRLDSTGFGGLRLLPYAPIASPNTQPRYALAHGPDGVDLLVWDTISNSFIVNNHLAYPAYDLTYSGTYLILAAGSGGTYLVNPTPSGGEIVGSIHSSYGLPNHQEVVAVSHFLLIRGQRETPPDYPLQVFDIQDPENPHLAMALPSFPLIPPIVASKDSFFCVIGLSEGAYGQPDSTPRFRLYRITGGDSIVEVYNLFMDYLTSVVLLSPTKILWSDNSTVYFGKPGSSGIPWISLPESIERVRLVFGGVLAFDANRQLYYASSTDWWAPPLPHRSFVKQVLRLPYSPLSVARVRNATGHFVAMLDPEGGINFYQVIQEGQKIQWVARPLVFPQAYGPMTGSDSGRLYIASDGHTVTILDLSNIENPVVLGTVAFPDSIVALAGNPDFLGVGFDNGAFSVYHWQNPTSPELITQYTGDANILMMDYEYASGLVGSWQTIAALYQDSTVVTVDDQELNPVVHPFPAQPLACSVGGGFLGAAAGAHGYYLQGWNSFWYYPAHGNALDVDLGQKAQFVAMGPYGVAAFSAWVNVEEKMHQRREEPVHLQHTLVRSQLVLQGHLEPGVIEIFDAAGRRIAQRILTKPQSSVAIPMVSWPTGVYLLRYSGRHSPPITQKFLKIR